MSSAAVQSMQQHSQQYPHSSPAPSNFTPEQSPDLTISSPSSQRQQSKFLAGTTGNGTAPPNTPQSFQQKFSPSASSAMDTPKAYQGSDSSQAHTPQSRRSPMSQDPSTSARSDQHTSIPVREASHNDRIDSARSAQPWPTPEVPNYADVDRSRQHAGSTPGANNDSKRREQRIVSEPQKPHERASRGPAKSRSATALNQPSTNSPLSRQVQQTATKPATSYQQQQAPTGLGLSGSERTENDGRGQTQQRSRQEHLRNAQPKRETKFGDYILGQTIGEGEFGKVKMGWKKEGGVQVAIKLIRREALGNDLGRRLPKIYREIKILQGLNHDNIVRLHEMVETDKHIGIILEYASGGELFDYILNERYLKDAAARPLFAQLVSGVGYLHQKGIVHRDLKLENLLLDRRKNIVITDFGFANTFDPKDRLSDEIEHNLQNKDFVKKWDLDSLLPPHGFRRGDLMQTSCGSPCYAAPELVVSDSLYTGRLVDVWSCGVILYAMLAGYLPFDDDPANPEGDNINLLYKYIVTTPLTFPEYVTPHARDILRRILVPDPRKRADLFEVARHSWLNDYAHALAFITSGDEQGLDVTPAPVPIEELRDAPSVLTRSASVRETVKPTFISPGSLTHPGATIMEETRSHTPRDAKRRTVQLEYVAPQSQTVRGGEGQQFATSPKISSQYSTSPKTRARARTSSNANGPVVASSADSPQIVQTMAQQDSLSTPANTRPMRSPPRSASDSSAFISVTASPEQRPATQGSLNGTPRLPARGNSYARPVAATVAPTNVQGRFAQPTYTPAGTQSDDLTGRDPATGRPLSAYLAPYSYEEPKRPSTGQEHLRSRRTSTVESITSRIFGRSNSARRQSQVASPHSEGTATKPERKNRMFPPISLQNARPADVEQAPPAPRKSTDSRRSSFGFSRRDSEDGNKRSSKRFSFLATGFSKMSLSSAVPEDEYAVVDKESKRTSWQQQPPRSRHDSKSFLGMAFGQGRSRSPSNGTESSIPVLYDSNIDSRQRQPRLQQNEIQRGATAPDLLNYGAMPHQEVQASKSGASARTNQAPTTQTQPPTLLTSPVYPARRPVGSSPKGTSPSEPLASSTTSPALVNNYQGFSPGRAAHAATSPASHSMSSPGPNHAMLQKSQRKFVEPYEAAGTSGSSGGARRVMDWFRKRGKERSG